MDYDGEKVPCHFQCVHRRHLLYKGIDFKSDDMHFVWKKNVW